MPPGSSGEDTPANDGGINLAETALHFAASMHDGLKVERYLNHFQKLTEEVSARHAELLGAGAGDNVETRLAALKHILCDKHEYKGEDSLNIQSSNLARTIDRRQGNSIALSVLYIHTAHLLDWECEALNIGGYCVCRLNYDGGTVIFDPSAGCAIMQAQDLRARVKDTLGSQAELSASFYEGVTPRALLIQLQNVIKHRQIDAEDYAAALESVEMMRSIDPQEYRLLLDAGVLYARVDRPQDAINALEEYIERVPDARDRYDAEILLRQIHEDVM